MTVNVRCWKRLRIKMHFICISLFSLLLEAKLPILHWMANWVFAWVCVSLHAQKCSCKICAHHPLNSHHNRHLKHCYCRTDWELSVKAGSNICLELSGCFKTNLPAYDEDPWNQIQSLSPLNSTLWLSEERDAITQTTVFLTLTQLSLISCLRGMQRDRIMRR